MSAGLLAGTATGTRRDMPKNWSSIQIHSTPPGGVDGRRDRDNGTLPRGRFVPPCNTLIIRYILGLKKSLSRPLSRSVPQHSIEGHSQ